jgi:Uma2 family endonuclease
MSSGRGYNGSDRTAVQERAVPVGKRTFLQLVLEDDDRRWELWGGQLRPKPSGTFEHNHQASQMLRQLTLQLDHREFTVRSNNAHLRSSAGSHYIPDVLVVPMSLVTPLLGRQDIPEYYAEPVSLVVEFWDPPTDDYDGDEKIPEYQRRDDLEIWRIHPYEHTLISWVRQPDGSYTETLYTGGVVRPVALPGVSIDLDALFA